MMKNTTEAFVMFSLFLVFITFSPSSAVSNGHTASPGQSTERRRGLLPTSSDGNPKEVDEKALEAALPL